MPVAGSIQGWRGKTPRDANERPLEDIRMTISVEEMSRKKIEKNYGYTYPEN